MFRVVATFAAALHLFVSPARADVLVHDGGVSRDSEAVALVEARTGRAPALVMSADVLSGPTRLLTANATVERCEGGAIKLDPESKLDTVLDQVLGFELEAAIESLGVLDTLFPCAESLIPRALLARMAFLRGAALLDLGDKAAAKAAMSDALAFDPEYAGERGFPKEHKDLLAAAAQERATSARLSVWLGRTDGSVFVDGREYADAAAAGVAVRPGRHLVQIRTDAGTKGMWVRTDTKAATILLPGAGRRIWADGGRSTGGAPAMRILLTDEFGADDDVHIVQFKGRKHRGATFVAGEASITDWSGKRPSAGSSGAARASSEPAKRSRPAARTRAPATDDGEPRRVRIAVGGGYQFAMPFHYGLLAIDISGRPIGPVTVAAFARPGYAGIASFEDPDFGTLQGPVFLVPFGGSAGVQMPGHIAPYVRVGGQIAVNRDGADDQTFLGGVVVQGGVDLSPVGSAFLFRVQGEIGNLGAHVNARGWAGVGARF